MLAKCKGQGVRALGATSLAALSHFLTALLQLAEASHPWYIYQDAASSENHGYWVNFMPADGAQVLKINFVERKAPYAGESAIRISFRFKD